MKIVCKAFLAAKKPDWCTPVDVAIVVSLLAGSNGKPLNIAHSTLASRVGASTDGVRLSLTRMKKAGWIVAQSGKRRYGANTYELQLSALPLGEFKKIIISDEALKLAQEYMLLIRQNHAQVRSKLGRMYNRKLPKGWKQRWAYVIQKHLDLGSTWDGAMTIFRYMSEHEPKTFVRGIQTWERRWPTPIRTDEKGNEIA